MPIKDSKEWFLQLPWGKLALVSWGDAAKLPVLMVHGYMDSAATFIRLVECLPDTHYYVAFDMPGHGKSEPFPKGLLVSTAEQVQVIRHVVDAMQWDSVVLMTHSVGFLTGLFFNAIYPGKVSRIILLDAKPGLQWLQMMDLPQYFKSFYGEYYGNYAKYNTDDRRYTEDEALRAVMKARGMTREQAQVILERNLIDTGEKKFRSSWDRRQKIVVPLNFPLEFNIDIFTKNMPPSLYINAKDPGDQFYTEGKEAMDRIFVALESCGRVWMVDVNGGHDVHFTHPERVAKDVCAFLDRNFDSKSKL